MRSSTAVIVALRGPLWKSRGLVRSRPARGRRHGSPGDDWVDLLFAATAPARVGRERHPRTRRALSSTPITLGQTFVVTAGIGRVQREGGPIQEIRAGDVVSFPPGEKHWHGASLSVAMTHIAIQEQLDGKAVNWLKRYPTRSMAGSAV